MAASKKSSIKVFEKKMFYVKSEGNETPISLREDGDVQVGAYTVIAKEAWPYYKEVIDKLLGVKKDES